MLIPSLPHAPWLRSTCSHACHSVCSLQTLSYSVYHFRCPTAPGDSASVLAAGGVLSLSATDASSLTASSQGSIANTNWPTARSGRLPMTTSSLLLGYDPFACSG